MHRAADPKIASSNLAPSFFKYFVAYYLLLGNMADKTVVSLLASGISIEKTMKETYTEQAKLVKDKKIKAALLAIAKDEAEHEKIVEKLWEKYGGFEGV